MSFQEVDLANFFFFFFFLNVIKLFKIFNRQVTGTADVDNVLAVRPSKV